jgi:hypothetical protein
VSNRNGMAPHRRLDVVPAFSRTAIELQGHVVRLGAERVATALRVAVADLEPMLAGRIEMSRVGLQRLRKLS